MHRRSLIGGAAAAGLVLGAGGVRADPALVLAQSTILDRAAAWSKPSVISCAATSFGTSRRRATRSKRRRIPTEGSARLAVDIGRSYLISCTRSGPVGASSTSVSCGLIHFGGLTAVPTSRTGTYRGRAGKSVTALP
jgi:hypothetical protein